ncbi:hypothetical protein H4I96_08658 [Botrytis cinerea]
MVTLSNSPTANRIPINSTTERDLNEKTFEDSAHAIIMDPPNATPPKTSIDTSFDGVDPSMDFVGDNCQEYLRTLATSITEDSLLQLHTPTFIAVVGCGSPSLIPMYQEATNCPFPIYADPTKKLYDELGMMRTLNLGARPEYQRRGTLMGIGQSVLQSLKQIKGGKLFQGGDYQQVGGEFLFEPVRMSTPITSPADGPVGMHASGGILGNGDKIGESEGYEEKRITWCHRMKNTRDHAEIPEIREVLGFDEMVEGERTKRGGPKH